MFDVERGIIKNIMKNQVNAKSLSRIAAIQTIYQYHKSENSADINKLISQMKDFYKSENLAADFGLSSEEQNHLTIKLSVKYFEDLVLQTIDHLTIIQNHLKKLLSQESDIERLPILLLAVLEVGISEIMFFPQTPKNVIIDQFTNISNNMLEEHNIGFVNSILDKLSQKTDL
jgi:N utilization substance protein B